MGEAWGLERLTPARKGLEKRDSDRTCSASPATTPLGGHQPGNKNMETTTRKET